MAQATLLWRTEVATNLFLTLRFGAGQTWDGDLRDFSRALPLWYGAGLGVGYNTPIGSLTIDAGSSSQWDVAVYVQLGGGI